jgi:hypothetical protein
MLTGNLDKHPIQWKVIVTAPYVNRELGQASHPVEGDRQGAVC